jgi:thioredoxin-like negative regulator of GroEL
LLPAVRDSCGSDESLTETRVDKAANGYLEAVTETAAEIRARCDGHVEKPRLVFFHARNSGRSRRVEGYLSQVLQRRRNHELFQLLQVDVNQHADLAERFRIEDVPTIVVVEGKRVRGRLVSPKGCRDIEQLLAPWLR